MPPEQITIYWDACCFLAILNGEEEADVCASILNDAKDEKLRLVVSPLTMAETVRQKGSPRPLPQEHREKVLSFFENDFVVFANIDRRVSTKSLEFCWEYDLHARDALHLAAAIGAECDFLETSDRALLDLDGKIRDTALRIRKPTGLGQMNLPAL